MAMNSENLWRVFASTGRPEDYIRYTKKKKQETKSDGKNRTTTVR